MSTTQESPVVVLESLSQTLKDLKREFSKHGGVQVDSQPLRDRIKNLVHTYFNQARIILADKNFSVEILDKNMQVLFGLANKRARKSLYLKIIKNIIKDIPELQIKNFIVSEQIDKIFQLNEIEVKIINTLDQLLPSLSVSYRQVVNDLADQSRISFRGTTGELREILRELLDHLAPDEDVKKQKWFKLEVGTLKPTMKQKVYFILSARGLSKSETKVAEDTTSVIDNSQDGIASIARSAYVRGSAGTHTSKGSQMAACKQYKMYVDSVLGEILAIHSVE